MLLLTIAAAPAGKRAPALRIAILYIFFTVLSLGFKIPGPAPGVVAEILFNEGSGSTASDGSGNGHSGSLVNGPLWVAGKYGQAVGLDGTNDYVNFADHANFTLTPSQSYTWSGWVRNNNFNQWSTVWSQTINSSTFFYFYAHTSNDGEAGPVTNGVSVYWYSGTSRLVIHSNNNVLTAGQWSYIAVTYNGSAAQASRFTIYVNGNDVTNRTDVVSSGTLATIDPTNIRLGSNQPYGEYLNGSVDEFRYYRRQLSLTEIQADMNLGNTPDTEAPNVNITAPSGVVSGNVNVTANATDNTGVTGVQFKLDGNNLGAEDLTAPYSVPWNTTTVSNGNHVLTAVARDAAGNLATSAEVMVSVTNDLVPPSVNLTAPAAGPVQGTISLTADASDNTGVVGVQFLLDGNNLGAEDLTPPYSLSLNTTTISDGNHSLSARARDAAGNTATATAVAISVENNPPDDVFPSVNITSPTGGTVSGTVNVTASASDNVGVVGVQFLLDGNNLGSEDLSSPYSVSWISTGASNGSHTLTARARDAAGNTTVSDQVTVNVNNTNLVAAFSFNETSGNSVLDHSGRNNNGTLVNGPTRSPDGRFGSAIRFDGSNDYINIPDAASLDLTNGMTLEAWVNPSNLTGYKTVICKDRGTGNFTYTMAANNNASNTNNQRPNTRIRIGSNNRTAAGTSKLQLNTWTHLAATYDGSNLRLFVNGVQVRSLATTGNITVTANPLRIGGTTALSGQYFAGLIDEVRIYNRALSQAEIQTDMNTAVAPDLESPDVTITSPAAGNVSGTVDITASATDNVGVAGVQFQVDGVNFGAEDVTPPYSVPWNTETAGAGTHTLRAIARDAAGNTATSSEVSVEVIPDFNMNVLTPTRNVEQTGTTDFRIYVTYLNGYTTTGITLSVTGLPSNTTSHFLFNPMSHQGETQLIVNTSNAPLGTYPITITATSADGIIHSQPASLTVTTAADYALTVSPSIANVARGNAASFTVNVNETNDYQNPVTLSVVGVPAGVTAGFNPASVVPAGVSNLLLNVSTDATPGTYNMTIEGTSGATVRTVGIQLTITSTPAVWTINVIGSTGTQNNCIRVGALKEDGLERVYVGTIGTGRMLEYSWSGTAWTGPVDVGGSPTGVEIHDCNIGDGRGDGKDRLYAASYDFNIYEIWNDATGWHQMTVGGLNGNLGMHMAMGDARNDGTTRLYAASTQHLFEFTWNGTSWTKLLIANTPGAHGVAIGKARDDGKNYIYIASISSGDFEVYWNGTSWVTNPMGDSGDSRGVGLGDGRNDGKIRVYAAIYDGTIREFTWTGTNWTFVNLPNTGIQNVHAYVVPGRNDGVNRIYTDNGNGKVWEYTWTGTNWTTYNMGGGSDYMYGLHYGMGRNDGLYRLYSTDRGSVNRVYEFSWQAPNPLVLMQKESESAYLVKRRE